MKESLSNMEEKLDKVCHFIDGNGQPGAKVRLALLEGSNKFKNKILWIFFATIMSIAGTVVGAMLSK